MQEQLDVELDSERHGFLGTAVIGGIYEVSSDQGEDRVPGLANVPVIGYLFKNKRRTDENEELLIFITPRIVRL